MTYAQFPIDQKVLLVDANGAPVLFGTSASGATAQQTKAAPLAMTDRSKALSTSSSLVAAANPTRTQLLIQNTDAAINIFLMLGAAATASTYKLVPGASISLTGTNQALNAIAASGTPNLVCWEF